MKLKYQSFSHFRKLMDGLRCIDDYSTNCLDEDHKAYFRTLYNGTKQVILVNLMSQCHIIISQVTMDLCLAGEYQTDYLKHARCMRSAQTEYESCVDTYHLWLKALIKVRK